MLLTGTRQAARATLGMKSLVTNMAKSAVTRQPVTQNSRLLSLPAELRNVIYELVATTPQAIVVGQIAPNRHRHRQDWHYCPPFSLVCKQIREEYEKIYLEKAKEHAAIIHIKITDFIYDASAFYVPSLIYQLPECPDRSFKLHIFLTNSFDAYLEKLHHLLRTPWAVKWRFPDFEFPDFGFEITYDPKSFDEHYCRQKLARLNMQENKMSKAFEEAFERYAPQTSRASGKKRRRRA